MKVILNRVNQDYLFEVKNQNGHKVVLDNISKKEGKVAGVSPMELLLVALAGCSMGKSKNVKKIAKALF